VKNIKRLVLGTANFGMDYGGGEIEKDDAHKILDYAAEVGIEKIDTARVYGESERILGEYKNINQFSIISKAKYKDCLNNTLAELKLKYIYGYLVHGNYDIGSMMDVYDDIKQNEKDGLVHKIGFSVYTVEDLELILNRDLNIQIIELPFNALDFRFSLFFTELKKRGIDIYARNVFGGGRFFHGGLNVKEVIDRCLSLILDENRVDHIIVGVDSLEQLKQIVEVVK
jgi:aryl-alcohol dehydrogenase-like predicted oxidoreductase